MIFQIFTQGNFPDTNLASDPVTRVPENIKKERAADNGSIFFILQCVLQDT
jgi:hypothetical protein